MYAPKEFFDRFPPDQIQLPARKAGDMSDTHLGQILGGEAKRPRHYRLLGESYPTVEDGLRAYLQAHLATSAFVDEQIGDHGYHIGEKDHVFKDSPWEESAYPARRAARVDPVRALRGASP